MTGPAERMAGRGRAFGGRMVCVALVVGFGAVAGAKPPAQPESSQSESSPSRVPRMTLDSATRGRVVTAARAGRPLILAYVRADADRGRRLLAELLKVHKAWSKRVSVVAVTTDLHGGAKAARALTKTLKIPFPFGIDTGEAFWAKAQLRVYPTTLVVAADGRVVAHIAGLPPGAAEVLDGHLRALFGMPARTKAAARPQKDGDAVWARLKRLQARQRVARVERKFVAVRASFDAEGLPVALGLYEDWRRARAALLDPDWRALAEAVLDPGDTLPAATATLESRAAGPPPPPGHPSARAWATVGLWYGRALRAAGQAARAEAVLAACADLGVLRGQCGFERAALAMASDPARAVTLCRAALARLAQAP